MSTGSMPANYKKPWWLVIFLVLVLFFFGTYIGWLNSPLADQYESFGAYLFGPRATEVLPSPAPSNPALIARNENLPVMEQPVQDSIEDSWTNETPVEGTSDTGSDTEFDSAESTPSPAPVQPVTGYYIKAGEFSSRSSALFRMRELRQGNYQPRLIEPTGKGGKYLVAVGEYDSYAKAREQSRAIDFILEIRTSVEKKE